MNARAGMPAWAAVTAWGAGLLELALGAGAFGGAGGNTVRVLGITLVMLGAAGLVWGAATLTRGRLIVPRVGVSGALLGIVLTVLTVAADPARVSVLTAAAASVLLIVTALACARQSRKRADAAPPRIAVLLVAGVLVSAVVTPALSASEAGQHAVPHGEHTFVDPGHH
ncbi:hypothetical protein LG299_07830 [Microbacterium lacus]|uniref:hypothetical protein n=1 Tax=Microbacterium lacus TaxID=415217 RepID=UPI0038511A59